MRVPKGTMAAASILGLVALCGVTSVEAASALPGGAGSLREFYDNWAVTCRLQGVDAANPKPGVSCGIVQVQEKTRQRVLAIGVNPTDNGGAKGAIIMPFGLALAAGAQLQIDDGPKTKPAAFSTCTPQGCIIPIEWPKGTIDGLRAGTALKVSAASNNGQPLNLSIPLKGFSNAFNRAVDLLK